MTTITASAGLAWLAGLGWGVAHGPAFAPGSPRAERADYGQAAMERRLRDAPDRTSGRRNRHDEPGR